MDPTVITILLVLLGIIFLYHVYKGYKEGEPVSPGMHRRAWKGLPFNWKSFLAAGIIASFLLVFVASAAGAEFPKGNLFWTVMWIYLTIEAWKYLRWRALLVYPLYFCAYVVSGLVLRAVEVDGLLLAIVLGGLNIGGLILFYKFISKEYANNPIDSYPSKKNKRINSAVLKISPAQSAMSWAIGLSAAYIISPLIVYILYDVDDLGGKMGMRVVTGFFLFIVIFITLWFWGTYIKKDSAKRTATQIIEPPRTSDFAIFKQDKTELEKNVDGYVSELKGRAIAVQDISHPGSLDKEEMKSSDKSVVSDEAFYEKAFRELEGEDRKVGLWAKVFAEADGKEAIARANYLKIRAGQLAFQHEQTFVQRELLSEAETVRKEATRKEILVNIKDGVEDGKKANALLPKMRCPDCKSMVPVSSFTCPNCGIIMERYNL